MSLFEMIGCDSCSLKSTWHSLSSPQIPILNCNTDAEPRILFVGGVPDEQEDRNGSPFSGRGARFLRNALPAYWRNNVFATTIVRCHTKQEPDQGDIDACTGEYLLKAIREVNPHVIVALGHIAFHHFCPGTRLSALRGIPIPIEVDGKSIWLYGLLDPSDVEEKGSITARPNSDTGKDKFNTHWPIFKSDVDRLFKAPERFTDRPERLTLPEVIYPQTLLEAQNLFNRLDKSYAIDYEASKLKPHMHAAKLLTSAISDTKTTFAWPIHWPGCYINWGEEFLRWCLSQHNRTWIAHNASMELVWSTWKLPDVTIGPFGDTMAKAKFIYNRAEIYALDTQAMIHLGMRIKGYTETELHRAMHRNDESVLRFPMGAVMQYNGYDSWSTSHLDNKLILPEKQRDNYARALHSIRSTVAMEVAGLHVDFEEVARQDISLLKQAEEIEKRIKSFKEVEAFETSTRTLLRLTAPEDIYLLLTKFCSLDLSTGKKKDEGKRSTDDAVLQKVADKHELVPLIQDHREILKLQSTYIDPLAGGKIIGVDGLVHPAYKVTLTATGRLSSENPNIQNYPVRKHREIRGCFVAPPGFIWVSGDYGQLEARVIGMSSRDRNLRRSMIEKEDIHSKWLDRAIDIYPQYLSRLARKSGTRIEKEVRKAGRTIIKTDLVFASFYGSKMASVSARTEIPQDPYCRLIFEEFWTEYADVKLWVDGKFIEYWKTGIVQTLTGLERNEILPGNEPVNTPMQGTAAHIVLEAQNALYDLSCIKDVQQWNVHKRPRWNIHDDNGFLVPDNNDTEQYIKDIGEEMVKPRFPWSTLPLMVEMKVGYDWAHLEPVAEFTGEYYDL